MIEERIRKSVQNLIDIWTAEIDGDIPVRFVDELALGLFASCISAMCKRYYNIGKKEQKKKHKQRAIRRYYEST